MHAGSLYNDIASAYSMDPKRWASTEGMVDVLGRVVLPYSLGQLSAWLARGGEQLGAPALTAFASLHEAWGIQGHLGFRA